MKQLIKQTLGELVAVKSISGDQKNAQLVIDLVANFLQASGSFKLEKSVINGYPNLLASSGETSKDTVWAAIHLDVVPAPDDQFTLKTKGDRLMGRGVLDMKGVASAFIAAGSQVDPQRHNIGLLFTTDEEKGGKNGAAVFAKRKLPGQVWLVLDGGAHWTLEKHAKGIAHYRVEAVGTTAHGARPWLGDNALDRLINWYAELREWFDNTYGENDGSDFAVPSCNLGVLNGGEAANQVAARAQADLDFRFTNQSDLSRIKTHLRKTVRAHNLKLQSLVESSAHISEVNQPAARQFQRILDKRGLKASGEEAFAFGATDARYFAEAGKPTIVTRPPGDGQHGNEEWVSWQGLCDLASVIKDFYDESATRSV